MKNPLLMLLLLGVALTGCSSKKSQFESQFMDGCVGPNGGRELKKLCSCVVEKLEARYSIDDLFALAQQPHLLLRETRPQAKACSAKN